ncbi:MAG: aminoglycoside phosphotransferase family protein [Lentisphaerae bacterium]|nr:aminoglycoside phosphotransferase family protein [Lentisphaerota bacterium]
MMGHHTDDDLQPHVAALLQQAGLSGSFTLEPLPGAGNNRVLRVRVGEASVLLKSYFRHPEDPRDRLGAEFAFYRLAWEHGLRLLPRPLAADPANGLGLYEFIHGRRLTPADVNAARVEEAGAMFTAVNALRETAAARQLPIASEASFSIADHLTHVDARLKRLEDFPVNSEVDSVGAEFVHARLQSAWAHVRERVPARAAQAGWDLQAALPQADRRLSPSDFGFHNAVVTREGHLRFVDCEYGGWDDPAKTICDFYCHPALPVPPDTFPRFQEAVLAGLTPRQGWEDRVLLLMPVHRIKWCCIMLNEFLPMDAQRRKYSRRMADPAERKRAQLQKAEAFLQREVIERAATDALFRVG